MTVTTCGGSFDSVLSIHTGCAGSQVICNDDFCGLQSSVTFAATASTTYYIRVASYGTGAGGSFPVNITPPPSCSGLVGTGSATPATVLQGSSTLLTVAMSATAAPNPPTGCVVTLNLSSIGGSSTQATFDNGTNGDVTPGDNTFSFAYTVPGAQAPGTYSLPWSAVDSVARTTSGTISLTVTAPAPANDNCAGAIALPAGTNGPYTNVGATNGGVVGTCTTGYSDVWFSYTPTCPGSVTVSTPCVGFDSVVSAYGSCGGASLACNDDAPGCGFGGSTITFVAVAGTTYYIRVASWSAAATGSFTVTITAPPPCTGLQGSGAASPSTVVQGSASLLTVAMSAVSAPIPPTGCAVTINLSSIGGSATQTMYDDGSNGDVTPADNIFSFNYTVPGATTPATYALPWSATDSVARTANGTISLTVIAPPPGNDGCGSPIALSLGANGPFSNAAATNSGTVASCGTGGYNDVWFSYTTGCSGSVTVSSGCGGFDTVVSAYASCGGAELACNDDAPGCGVGGSLITFAASASTTYLIRVASYTSNTAGSFTVTVTTGAGGMALAMTEPGGPGSGTLQINFTNGPASGLYFLVVTFYQGAFPNGWLDGVDIPVSELQGLITTGPPFLGPLDGCGAAQLGPFGGLGALAGFPIYAVALGIPQPGPLSPTVNSPAITFTIL